MCCRGGDIEEVAIIFDCATCHGDRNGAGWSGEAGEGSGTSCPSVRRVVLRSVLSVATSAARHLCNTANFCDRNLSENISKWWVLNAFIWTPTSPSPYRPSKSPSSGSIRFSVRPQCDNEVFDVMMVAVMLTVYYCIWDRCFGFISYSYIMLFTIFVTGCRRASIFEVSRHFGNKWRPLRILIYVWQPKLVSFTRLLKCF